MTEYNILILSAGRRVELVQCFQDAARRLRIKSCVVAADCSNTAPALYFADKHYIVPKISEPNYINSIIKICKNENVALVVPTIDTDLLSCQRKAEIESVTEAKVLISDYDVVSICAIR